MLKNYFKIALRSMMRNKVYSFINIFGLAVGLTSAILILLWIADEISYDQFHPKSDRLYKAMNRAFFEGKVACWQTTPSVLGPALKKEFPEIKEVSRVNWVQKRLLRVGEKTLHAPGTTVDPGFLTMFGFPLLQGNKENALNDLYSIVITESLAKKLFGNQNALHRTIRIEEKENFKVTGIMKDLPNHTEFKFEYLLTWEYLKKIGQDHAFWGNNSYLNYVELQPNASLEDVNRKIRDITIQNSNKGETTEVFLHPAKYWRLYSKFENGKIAGGRIEYVRLFGIIAGFILLIACINFMNLATARSEKRVKEVGIRKVVGAVRSSLIGQFLGEAMLISIFAFALGLLMTELTLPAFNLLTEKKLAIAYGNIYYWLAAFLFMLFTGLLAGSYPAFYLSSFNAVKVLKGTFKSPRAALTPRRLLVIVQFTISIALVIGTIVVYRQIQYARERESGYEKNRLVYHNFTGDIEKKYELIKKNLIDQGIAQSVCKTNQPITSANSNTWGMTWKGKDPQSKIIFDQMTATQDFTKTMGIQMIEGRDIDMQKFATDSNACIVNQSAAKVMRFKSPIGENILYDSVNYKVVGVFKDFIWGSPYAPLRPMFVRGGGDWYNYITIRLSVGKSISEQIRAMEVIFKKYNPYYPFDFKFVDAEYEKKFKSEQLVGRLSNIFALLTIIISCLGLFGLAAYTAEQRSKEIGIRKVLGASVLSIISLLSRDFIRLVIISIFLASPLAWYFLSNWLQAFPYRVQLNWWVFVLSGAMAVMVAILTVSFQAYKASMVNPVDILKYE